MHIIGAKSAIVVLWVRLSLLWWANNNNRYLSPDIHNRMRIKALLYNPQHLAEDRCCDIAAECANFDIILLAGTGRHQGTVHPVEQTLA